MHTLARWWQEQGRSRYSDARDVYVVADSGGSNGYRVRLCKWEVEPCAHVTGLRIHVSHFPPGTSKWNHREACSASSA